MFRKHQLSDITDATLNQQLNWACFHQARLRFELVIGKYRFAQHPSNRFGIIFTSMHPTGNHDNLEPLTCTHPSVKSELIFILTKS